MIYCVEDDSAIRDLMVYTLNASGFEAMGFENDTSFWAAISGCVLDTAGRNMNMHENQRIIRDSKEDYERQYNLYLEKYWC